MRSYTHNHSRLLQAAAILLALGLSLAFPASKASADSISFDLTQNNLGLSGSMGTVVVDLVDPTHALITFTANLANNLGFVDGHIANVNFDTVNAPGGVSFLAVTPVPDLTSPSQGGATVDGFGDFNLTTTTGNASTPFPVVQFVLDNITATWASASAVLTANGHSVPGQPEGFTVSAHFLSFTAGLTGFAANGGPPSVVPAPPSVVLAGLGVLCLLGFAAMRRRRRALAAA